MTTPEFDRLTSESGDVDVSFVIPVYNSELSIRRLVDRIVSAFHGQRIEIILIDDGSRDRSWAAIREAAAGSPLVHGIRLMRNYGQHNALLAGIRSARGERIVTMDDDLQHSPEDVPKMLAELDRGFDVVYGTPRVLPHSLFRNVSSWVTKLALARSMGPVTAKHVSAFRCFKTDLREAFRTYQSPYVSIDVLLTWATTRFGHVVVEHHPRQYGESNYTFRKLIVHAMTMMTGFSTWPLRVASLVGFFFTLVGFAVLGWVVGRYLIEHGSVPGFPFLASIITIFAGAQMFTLGIIGEYLARIHVRTTDRPAYTVSEESRRNPVRLE